jgi:O-antigen ligase
MPRDWRARAPLYLAGSAAVTAEVSIFACELLLGLALLAFLVSGEKPRWPPVILPLAAWIGWTLLSLALNGHVRAGLPQVKKFYVYLILLVVYWAFRGVEQIRVVALGWALGAALSSAWGMEQFARKYKAAQAAHQDFYTAYVNDRIIGFMDHWMTFSSHMMMALLVIGALLLFSRERRWAPWLAAAGVVVMAGLLAAQTRSMWLGAAGGGLYLLWFGRRILIAAVPVFAAMVLWANPFNVRERAMSMVHPRENLDSNRFRTVTRAIGWEMIKAHPIFGVGPEEVGPQHEQYIPAYVQRPLPPGYYDHLHNIYFHFAAERGLPALAALLWFLGQSLFDFLRALQRLPPKAEQRWVLHAAVSILIAVLLSGYEEVNVGHSIVLYMLLAVIACGYVAVASVPLASEQARQPS